VSRSLPKELRDDARAWELFPVLYELLAGPVSSLSAGEHAQCLGPCLGAWLGEQLPWGCLLCSALTLAAGMELGVASLSLLAQL
jgi:hypothetical protein